MTGLIETVARKLWEHETETDCPEWDQLGEFRKNETCVKAHSAMRAAIRWMLENGPTPYMLARTAGVEDTSLAGEWNMLLRVFAAEQGLEG